MLQELLNKYKKLYLKPSHGSQGKGICRISILPDHSIEQAALEKTIHYPSFEEFWNKWEPTLMQKSYLAQEAIIPAILNGKRYDFRILAHYTHEGYKVTGVGIRQSETQEITTHIPNGGKLIPYEQVQTVKHDQFIEKAVKEIGRHLTAKMSFFGEFSIDAGVSDQGKYVIYEINSKPMSFDEKEIEYRRIQTLGRLFFEMSGF